MEPKFETYLIDYEYDGGSWSLDMPAASFDDAHARLQALRQSGRVEGVMGFSIPAFPGAGIFVRLFCWWKNRRRPA